VPAETRALLQYLIEGQPELRVALEACPGPATRARQVNIIVGVAENLPAYCRLLDPVPPPPSTLAEWRRLVLAALDALVGSPWFRDRFLIAWADDWDRDGASEFGDHTFRFLGGAVPSGEGGFVEARQRASLAWHESGERILRARKPEAYLRACVVRDAPWPQEPILEPREAQEAPALDPLERIDTREKLELLATFYDREASPLEREIIDSELQGGDRRGGKVGSKSQRLALRRKLRRRLAQNPNSK